MQFIQPFTFRLGDDKKPQKMKLLFQRLFHCSLFSDYIRMALPEVFSRS